MCRYWPTEPLPYKAGQANRKHTCTSERTHLERERERGENSRRQSVSVDNSKVGYCYHDRNVLTTRSRFCRLVVLPQCLQRGHPVWRLHGNLPHHFTKRVQTQSKRFMKASNTQTGIQIFWTETEVNSKNAALYQMKDDSKPWSRQLKGWELHLWSLLH